MALTIKIPWDFSTKKARYQPEPVGVVTDSLELQRILALPRRVLDLEQVPDVTPLFHRPGGNMSFWPIQSAALYEAALANGLFAPIAVSGGKSLICLSLPTALDSKRAVILIPATLRRQVVREARTIYNKHFVLPMDKITFVSYEELSTAVHADTLDRLQPDLVICDEVHNLRNFSAARTKRFKRYMDEHPECRFAALSGTITSKSIMDYGYLIELALRKSSVLPRDYPQLLDWSGVLDARPIRPMKPGALRQLCSKPKEYVSIEEVRDAYRLRLIETQGVVASAESDTTIGSSLIIRRLKLEIPRSVQEVIAGVKKTWSLDGNAFESALLMKGAVQQVSCGFFYRWLWPDDEVDYEWLEARTAWHREVAERLRSHPRPNMDSPFLLAGAAERYRKWNTGGRKGPLPGLSWASETWPEWRQHKDKDEPPKEAVWIDEFMVDAAISWAKSKKDGAIIWTAWNALGERIAKKGKMPYYGAGSDASVATAPLIVCSIHSQQEGKNLQHRYHTSLLTSLPGAPDLEQTIGRTHRKGQLADEVLVEYFGHTPEAEEKFEKNIEDSSYVNQTTGLPQKILFATKIR